MPDKFRMCDNQCLRCWRNRLKHGNPETKKYLKTHNGRGYHIIYNKNEGKIKRKKLSISINISDLVISVKKEIMKHLNNLTVDHQQCLFLGNIKLNDSRSLESYNIQKGTVLRLVYKNDEDCQIRYIKLV
jgi:uncharacterized lipoprotein YehR (DUF1307 family)